MLRLYVKSRPYLAAGAILFLTGFNTANALRVPMAQVPAEVFDRFLSRVEADAPAEVLRLEADQGNALAAFYYALRHTGYCQRDLRIAVDRDLAFAYMQKACDLSHRPRAEAVLALYHLNGWGTKEDLAKAMELATQAKAKGQTLGYRVLGECHLRRAERLAEELAAGPPGAEGGAGARSRRLGELETEVQAALDNLGFAAERGNAGALKALAKIHDQGDLGRPRNHRMATECYKQAALRRDERAARTLAERYELGVQVERDLKLAYAWTLVELQLAEEKAGPRRRRDDLEKRLTVTEKLCAQDQAGQWLALMPSEGDSARARLDPDR
jgi:TPR repeat protein